MLAELNLRHAHSVRRRIPSSRSAGTSARLAVSSLALGLVLLGAPPAGSEAQPTRRPYRIGVLNEAWAADHPTVEGLKVGLKALGFEEGRDVVFDIRFTEGNPRATPKAAMALVNAGVDVIFTSNESATQAAKAATGTLPIIFTLVGDPVAAGIVVKLAQPGGNLTGISSLTTELVAKRLEVLKALVPNVRRVWAIYYADDPSSIAAVQKARDITPRLGLEVIARPVRDPDDLGRALKSIRSGDALLPPDIATMDIPGAMLEVALSSRVPAVFPAALWVGHGALVSYGSDYHAQGVQAARLVAKILRGAQPKDLPVEGATKIGLTVNLKTAVLLGVTVPPKLRLRADTLLR